MVAPEELFELKRFIEKQLGLPLEPWQLAVLEQTLFNPNVTQQTTVVYRKKSVFDTLNELPSTHRITLEWPVEVAEELLSIVQKEETE